MVGSERTAEQRAKEPEPARPPARGLLSGVAGRALMATVATGATLIVLMLAIIFALEARPVSPDRSGLFTVYADVFKTIIAGVVVAMLGVLIPAVIGEARYAFERMKESRAAYSSAKTGIDYLKLRLSTMDLAEAAAFVQHVHIQKHLAELYDEFSVHLWRRYKGLKTPQMWDDEMYEKLFLTRDTLECEAMRWDKLTPEERIAVLNYALPTEPEGGSLTKSRYARSMPPA
jgi:hypothetical protein